MTNWEHLFGTPERAIHTETEFHSWPFFIAVCETSRMSSCTTSKRLLASFCEEADYLECSRPSTTTAHRVGGAMNRPGCNWGCLLFIAAAIAIDAAAIYAIRALALGLMAMAVAACG